MLVAVNLAQLVLYIALLALAGQGVLHLLAGAGREDNFFYRLLRLLSLPFTALVRRALPRRVAGAPVPLLTFVLLAVLYAAVTVERADLCLRAQRLGQAGCR